MSMTSGDPMLRASTRAITPAIHAFAALFLVATADAQTLKSGTLTLVVPFAAGGPSDVAGRIVAQGLSEVLGQNVVVENPVGAGGTVGSLRVSKGTPDGSQFVIGNIGTHAWSQSLYKNPPYNTLADFTMLGLLVEAPRVIITPKNFPANTLQEFIAHVKANQSQVKYGHAGPGSASHVSCILLNAALGVDIVAVPYRGLAVAMQDLIAGRIDYMCDSPSTSKPQMDGNFVKSGRQHRQAALADPAAAPDRDRARSQFRCQRLAGAVPRQGHAGADRAPAQRCAEQDARPALAAGALSRRWARRSRRRTAAAPEYFRKFVGDEIARWSGPIKASGVTVE